MIPASNYFMLPGRDSIVACYGRYSVVMGPYGYYLPCQCADGYARAIGGRYFNTRAEALALARKREKHARREDASAANVRGT